MKIAVIGSGISGLSAAYYLSKKHKVDLFEQDDHFGGHTFTYDIKEENKVTPVDLGFIVFNELTYPNLIKFFSITFKSCFFRTNFFPQRSSNPDGRDGLSLFSLFIFWYLG